MNTNTSFKYDKAVVYIFVILMVCVACHKEEHKEIGHSYSGWQEGEMDIHHIYTGRGEANFFIFPDGTSMLVDAGDWDPSDYPKMCKALPDTSRRAGEWIARYVEKVNPSDKKVDYLMVSHFHNDHIGDATNPARQTNGRHPDYILTGIAETGEKLYFKKIIDRGWPYYDYIFPPYDRDIENYRSFLNYTIEQKQTVVEAFEVGRSDQIVLKNKPDVYQGTFSVQNLVANGKVWNGDNIGITSYYELNPENKSDWQNENSKSIGICISYGPFRYFTAGDLSGKLKDAEQKWVDIEEKVAEACGPVDVCKANHHAYLDAMTDSFIRHIQAKNYIIPVWDYEHIQPTVIERMLSQSLYPGQRMIFPTHLPDALHEKYGKEEWMKSVCQENGHVVVKVFDQGRQYKIYILSAENEENTVKAIYGPFVASANNQKQIKKQLSITDFGLVPNSRENATPYVQRAIEVCKKQQGSTLYFPKGRYDFWPQHCIERDYYESNTTDTNPKQLAVLIEKMEHFILDGGGSEFIMHGRMQPLTTDSSCHIQLKNFSIDWDIPLTAEAVVVHTTPHFFDIEIDQGQFPYQIEKDKLMFVGEGWKSPLGGIMRFTPDTRRVEPYTGDITGATQYTAEEIAPGRIRLFSKEQIIPPKGALLVLRHSERDHSGIFLYQSKDVNLQNISIHHTCGLGILSQYSEDLSFNNVQIVPNVEKNRLLSGHDDGFHFAGCKGQITIEHCRWKGLMDDPINIHGICARIVEVVSPTHIRCRLMYPRTQNIQWGQTGELVAFVENESMRTLGASKIRGYKKINSSDFEIDLHSALPEGINKGDALENMTCVPDVTIRYCRFESSRARGLLVSTPGKVIIEHNTFESSGSAILIAGDANFWYESGAVKDVLIRKNEFLYPCMSSLYQFCEAIISIYPEIPKLDPEYPFHSNIRIEENTFYSFDYPVLYAKSVDGLTFIKNKLIRSKALKPFHPRKYGITLNGCKQVLIQDNDVDQSVLGKNIYLENMDLKELLLGDDEYRLEGITVDRR